MTQDSTPDISSLQRQIAHLEEKNAELQSRYEELRLDEEMYRIALDMTTHAISTIDIPKRSLSHYYNAGDFTARAYAMRNVPESVIEAGLVHPNDSDAYRRFFNLIYAGAPKGSCDMRVKEKNEGWTWINTSYHTIFSADGKPLRAILFSENITARKKAEQRYRSYKAAVSSNADLVWEANLTKDVVLEGNDLLLEVFGENESFSYSDLAQKASDALDDPQNRQTFYDAFSREALLDAYINTVHEVDLEYQHDFGRGARWLHTTAYLMTNDAEDVCAIICTSDITKSRMEIELLEAKAESDQLTGLQNRASVEQCIEQVLSSDQDDYANPHALILIDVDDLDRINDSHGRIHGNSVLQRIARVMQKTFRATDFLGRMDGDEFAIFMRDVDSANALALRTENLRLNASEARREGDCHAPVTLSIGIATSEPEDTFESLYGKANMALCQSKRAGKGCTRFYGD